MTTDTDNQLLERYASGGSEPAFRELVERHINLVHSAALREARGDSSLAEDITQAVFTELARRATALVQHPALAGWLYTCVRRMTANVRRSEDRRQRREQEAFTMNELLSSDPADALWQQVRPALDDVMHELNETDRTAVVLRFFEGRNLKEVGEAIGLSENAARMRVDRSLDKLRELLARRGVKSTASTLAAVLVAGAATNAPSALAATVASGALSAAAAGATATFTFAKFLSLAKTKTAAVGALLIVAAVLVVRHQMASNRAGAGSTGPAPSVSSVAVQSPAADTATETGSVAEGAPSTNAVTAAQMAFQAVDAESGDPLPNTKLYLFYLLPDGRGKAIRQVTDANGRLGVDMPQPPHRALNFFVTADGHVPKVTSWGFRRPMPSAYTMKLERGVPIGGVVIDEAGRPVSEAKIEFDGPGNDPSLADNIQFGPDTATRSDAEGRWSCNMIPATYGSIGVIVSHPAYAETSADIRPHAPDATRFVITLKTGFIVAGVVQDSQGNAVEGAKIREVRLNSEREHSRTTDAAGNFELKGMNTGELTLAVQANGFAPAVQTLQITGSVSALRFQLGPGQLLRGRVVDEEGHSLTNAFVETTRRALDKINWSTNTDHEGRFEWNSAPSEPLLYSVLAEGFNRGYAISLQADGTEHEIRLERSRPDKDTVQITGTVTDADTGQPLDGFKVMVGEQDADWSFPLNFYTTGKEGRFKLSLPAKSNHAGYQIEIEKEGYLPGVSSNLLRKDGAQTLTFQLRRGSGPAGVVLLPDGNPAAKASVLLCTRRAGVTLDDSARVQSGINTTTYRVETDAAGAFALAAASDPQGLIVVHDEGYAEVSLTDLASTGIARLQPWGRVEGKLILDSRPVANATIVAFNQKARYDDRGNRFSILTFRLATKTDSAGKFSFDKVPPGECTILQQQESPRVPRVGFSSYQVSTAVRAGAVSQVILGGGGRTIIGRAHLAGGAGSTALQGVPVNLRLKSGPEPGPKPKLDDFPSRNAFVQAFDTWDQANRARKTFGTFCDDSGAFRLTDIPAGTYELRISVPDAKQNSATPHGVGDPTPHIASLVREVNVPEEQSAEPLDLGTLELAPHSTSAAAQ